MGSVKQTWLDEQSVRMSDNRYKKEAAKLRERMHTYRDNPGFVAKLQQELDALKARRKEELAERKKHR